MITRLVAAVFLTAAAVQAEEPIKTDTTRAAATTAAPAKKPAKAAAVKLKWLPFDTVRATFPRAPRPLFLYISQAGCEHCEYMDTAVFGKPEVARYVNENLVPVKLDIFMDTPLKLRDTVLNETEFRKLLSIEGIPSYYFFDTAGQIIGAFQSQVDLLMFKRMLIYLRDSHYFLHTWDDFMQLPAATEEAINKRFEVK